MYYKIFNVDSTKCHLFKGILKNCRHVISWSRISKSDWHDVLYLVLFKHTIRSVTLTRSQVNSAGSRCNTADKKQHSIIVVFRAILSISYFSSACKSQINNLKVQLLQAGGRRSRVQLGISHPQVPAAGRAHWLWPLRRGRLSSLQLRGNPATRGKPVCDLQESAF